jgi:pantothenate synthetase
MTKLSDTAVLADAEARFPNLLTRLRKLPNDRLRLMEARASLEVFRGEGSLAAGSKPTYLPSSAKATSRLIMAVLRTRRAAERRAAETAEAEAQRQAEQAATQTIAEAEQAEVQLPHAA